tara:strand:+ start:10195 stop:10476 length:282 start_codon:yes stop_codon:yes gene_type:complete
MKDRSEIDTDLIGQVTQKLHTLLKSKQDSYGNSALEPLHIFAKGSAVDSLCARIDDKLARIKNVGLNDETEDTLYDLCGYLVLLIIAKDCENN